MASSKSAIVLIGMDRSGTSLCANVLGLLGMSLGNDLLAPDRFNTRGYFEDREIWRVHERLLAVLGRSWDTLSTVRPFPPGWWQSPKMDGFRGQLGQIVQARMTNARDGIWGFKDPRTVLLLPLWDKVFQECGLRPIFVVCIRHPGAVAQSLGARDGFPRLAAELLWLEKTLSACLAARDGPHCLIHYEDWFVDPWRSVERLIETTGLVPQLSIKKLKVAIAAVVDSEMRHDSREGLQIQSEAVARLYGELLGSLNVPPISVLAGYEGSLKQTAEFVLGVEQFAGCKLPSSVYAPSYAHCTEEDLRLIQDDASAVTGPLCEHNPLLIRSQRTLAERDTQLREHAEALAKAEQLIAEKDALLQRYADGLAQAEKLVLQRDSELKRYVEALANAQKIVSEQALQLRQYDAALSDAQRVAHELDAQLRRTNVPEPS